MEFDYVIAGGGSAGCVLAARLSEDPAVSVCLIEAGGEGRSILVRLPAGIAALVRGKPKICNWAFESVPQQHLNGRRTYQPRGKALGGSSAINAMLYVRGHRSDYDDWAEAGCAGWGWDDVLPFFRMSENNVRGSDALHGNAGPLEVSDQIEPRPVARAFADAAGQCQIRSNDDFNGPEQEGAGLYQVTQFHSAAKKGERCSAAAAYLHPVMHRPNLTVLTQAQATRVTFSGRRATGVDFRRKGVNGHVAARREVLVCGGAFGSPHLLKLSGIGPAAELAAHGIAVVKDLPGVGENLLDHLDVTLIDRATTTDVFGIGVRGSWRLFRELLKWRKTGTGLAATPSAEAGAFLKSEPGLERPDLQMHFVVSRVENHARKLRPGYGYTLHVCVLRPHSKGNVRLASADPLAAPLIDPRYLSDERDLALLKSGFRKARDVLDAPALSSFKKSTITGPSGLSDAALTEFVRGNAETIYHPVGTCRMGVDDDAVVDASLKVHGLDGIRVVDASVMPTLIGGNTNGPVMMIAEKAAAMIKAALRP